MAIVKTQAFFSSTDNINNIHVLIWQNTDKEPWAMLQIAHGVTDHIGRYERFARFMADNGVIVYGNDCIGHGHTAKSKNDLGNFGEPDSDVRMVDDMHKLHNIMRKKYPDLPFYLLGHSMGSFLAKIYASNFGYDISGLILVGTTQVNSHLSVLKDYLYPLGDMLGKDNYSTKGTDLLKFLVSKYFKEDDDNSWLSLSLSNRTKADSDPYFDYPITNASAMILAKLLVKSSSEECYEAIPYTIPVFLISGGKDPIGMFGRGVLDTCCKFEQYGISTDMKLYPAMRHEILNEDDYQQIYKDIFDWINNTLKGDYND